MKIYISNKNLEAVEKALRLIQDTVPSKKKLPPEEKKVLVSGLQEIIEKHVVRSQKTY